MIEEQLRDTLRSVVADEPPLGFDPLVAADLARRAVRRRRAVLASGAATVLLMGGAALAASVTGDGWTESALAARQTSDGVVPATPWSTPPANPPAPADPHGAGAVAAGLGKYLVGQLPVVVPAAQNIEFGSFGQGTSDPDSFNTVIFYDDAQGPAVLMLTFSATGGGAACEGSLPSDDCTTSGLPDGSTLETVEHVDPTQPTHRILSVRHLRAGGVSVQFSAYTYDNFRPVTVPLVRDTYPVTIEQLTALATDVNITL